jgi:hypothetical protein
MKKHEMIAASWTALKKIAEKAETRDAIPDGSQCRVNFDLRTRVDNKPALALRGTALLSAGFESLRAASIAPAAAELMAYLLRQLPPAKRLFVLQKLPAVYARTKRLPAITCKDIDEADALLKQLRAAGDPEPVRGAISVQYPI